MSTFFAHAAFTLMALCSVLLIAHWQKSYQIMLFSLLLLCGCGYLLSDIFGPLEYLTALWWIDSVMGNALPGVFWLVSTSILSEKRRIPLWQYALASLTLLLPLLNISWQLLFGVSHFEVTSFSVLIAYSARILEIALLCHVIVVALFHWNTDLVQERRYMRVGIVGVIATYLLIVIVAEQILNVNWPGLTEIKFAVLMLLAGTLNVLLFSFKEGALFVSPPPQQDLPPYQVTQAATTPPSPTAETQRIIDSMLIDKLYQKEGITISFLAKHLTVQEYKLRRLINGELGYRNFNDYLNFYRIQEVTEKLSQEKYKHLPVLTLALESGFRSVSAFNKAFKNTHGITPTEYRQQQPMP